jgi:DNA-binding SARP family transcriptional activator
MLDTSMKSLAVRLLGEFSVDGVEPQALGSRKARMALHLLALGDGQPVAADVLADSLWGDSPPASPDDQLAVLISRLRSVLGRDRIEHRDGGYVLHADWRDAAELWQLTQEIDRRRGAGNVVGAAAAARLALSLLRGSSAGELPGEWALERRAALERLIARARLTAAAALLDSGDWMSAAETAAACVHHDPYDEAALRMLMRGYVLGGQTASALSAYATVRQRLADDLGTDPASETAQLHLAILRGELSAITPAVRPVVSIVGRAQEIAFLDLRAAQARSGAAEVIVIDGEAGIGKTSLLRAWAAQRDAAGDTVVLASCGSLDRSMPLDAVLNALAGLLRQRGPIETAELLADDAALLGPLVGSAAGPRSAPVLADSMLGPTVIYGALTALLGRLARRGRMELIIDDAHLAGLALRDWIEFVRREGLPLMVVAAVRPGAGLPLPATAVVHLEGLDREAATELVGTGRIDTLYDRSRGNPLFLTELAQQAADGPLPTSLVDSLSARCDELGRPAALLRTAAVIGPELDLDLIAALLGRPMVELLDDCEIAVDQRFLVQDDAQVRFRHELVREALAATATSGRAALLHRQTGRVLAQRPGADPLVIADHARLGGDLALAASALREAAARASERFDHAAAEALLDDALVLHADQAGWLERARVRTRRGRYAQALADAEMAGTGSGEALEVSAWASYFDRRFEAAAQFADEGALAASDTVTKARCLAVAGRVRHAAGDLAGAQRQLADAMALAEGADRVTAAAWLGALRAHQSRPDEALALLRPAARGQIGAEHTSATMHALLFTGHAQAASGSVAQALATFARHNAEVERRHVPRFAGRGVNFAGWVLRNIGATSQALDHHYEAMASAQTSATPEVMIAVLEDLAELRVDADDPDGASALLADADLLLSGDLVFGWRLRLKHGLITARLAILRGDAEAALNAADNLAESAAELAVPRYLSAAAVLRHRARASLGLPVDLAQADADLTMLAGSVAIEAWWWTGDAAVDLGIRDWAERARELAGRLADQAGDYADTLRADLRHRSARWERALG